MQIPQIQFYSAQMPHEQIETDLEGNSVMEDKYLQIISNRERVT